MLAQSGENLALFQNTSNPEYLRIIFGSEDVLAIFSKHRKRFGKGGITKKRIIELVHKGTEMIFGNSSPETPYTCDLMRFVYSPRMIIQKPSEECILSWTSIDNRYN